eukprot:6368486-Amphidinium_carterae.1
MLRRIQVEVPLFLHRGKTTCCMYLLGFLPVVLVKPRKPHHSRSWAGPPAIPTTSCHSGNKLGCLSLLQDRGFTMYK